MIRTMRKITAKQRLIAVVNKLCRKAVNHVIALPCKEQLLRQYFPGRKREIKAHERVPFIMDQSMSDSLFPSRISDFQLVEVRLSPSKVNAARWFGP